MKFSFFNIYIILVLIWFVYNFIKRRKAIIAKQQQRDVDRQADESDEDILKKLRNVIESNDNYLEDEEDEDEDEDNEYIAPSSQTSYQKNYEEESRRIAEQEKIVLERQKVYENFLNKTENSIRIKADDIDYDYTVNRRKSLSIFKATHEDLRKAIIYNAILERRGKKIR